MTNLKDQQTKELEQAIINSSKEIEKLNEEKKADEHLKSLSKVINEHKKSPENKKRKERIEELKSEIDSIKEAMVADIVDVLEEHALVKSKYQDPIKEYNNIRKEAAQIIREREGKAPKKR